MFYIFDKDIDFMLLLSFPESWVKFVINYGALLHVESMMNIGDM